MSVCVISSAGGHLAEAMAAASKIKSDLYYVTYKESHVPFAMSGKQCFYIIDPHTSRWKYLINALKSLFIFALKRPRVVISNGAGIAIPTCLLAKFFGRKLIFIENGARVSTPSKTGKLLYKYSDIFLVQWEPLLKVYPTAKWGGPLL